MAPGRDMDFGGRRCILGKVERSWLDPLFRQSPQFPLKGLTGGQGTAGEVVQPGGLRATMDCRLLCALHRKPQKVVPSYSLHSGLELQQALPSLFLISSRALCGLLVASRPGSHDVGLNPSSSTSQLQPGQGPSPA